MGCLRPAQATRFKGGIALKIIERIKNGLDTFGKYWALVIVILFILPAFEALVMRYTLNRPTIWSQELCCMIFGAYFMIGGAYVRLRLILHHFNHPGRLSGNQSHFHRPALGQPVGSVSLAHPDVHSCGLFPAPGTVTDLLY